MKCATVALFPLILFSNFAMADCIDQANNQAVVDCIISESADEEYMANGADELDKISKAENKKANTKKDAAFTIVLIDEN